VGGTDIIVVYGRMPWLFTASQSALSLVEPLGTYHKRTLLQWESVVIIGLLHERICKHAHALSTLLPVGGNAHSHKGSHHHFCTTYSTYRLTLPFANHHSQLLYRLHLHLGLHIAAARMNHDHLNALAYAILLFNPSH